MNKAELNTIFNALYQFCIHLELIDEEKNLHDGNVPQPWDELTPYAEAMERSEKGAVLFLAKYLVEESERFF